MDIWSEVSTLPYAFTSGSAIVLDGEIHILGGSNVGSYTKHYKYLNGSWVEVSTLPYNFYGGSAVVLDGEIHILGGSYGSTDTNHYKYSNGSWVEVSTLPYNFFRSSAIVLDGEIHILGGQSNSCRTKHYKYSNGSWTEVSILPYNFYFGSAVVLDGEIHILGSYASGFRTNHYKYSNGSWIEVSTLPYDFYEGSAIVLDGEIHILGSYHSSYRTNHYKYSNGSWVEVSTLPYPFLDGSAVVLDGKINILGGNTGYNTSHYKYYTAINKVVYGDKTLIDLTADTVTKDKLARGYKAHEKHGGLITGTADILTCAKKVVICRGGLWATSSEEGLLNLNDTIVYLSYSGANVLLTAGSSSITIASPGASYVHTFKIKDIHYINRNQVIITYRYETNASGLLSRFFIRLITLKSDGTLAQSSQINGSGAPSATLNVEGYLIPMFEAKTSWMLIYTATTISTGAMAIYVSRMYAALSTNTLTIPSSSTWTTVAASNANTLIPYYFDSNFSEYGGLFFYDGANSKAELDIWAGYSGGNKNVYTSAAGDVDQDLIQHSHILGKTADGYLAVLRFRRNQTYSSYYDSLISLYSYDPVTCYFSLVDEYVLSTRMGNISSQNPVRLLNNGLLLDTYSNGLYSLTKGNFYKFAEGFKIEYNKAYPDTNEIGPLSDPFQGIFIS